MGRWRAAVLIGVHALIAAHIVQWLIAGSTLSPVEPSESMDTLETGSVNAGFIFFVTAIAATALFGRYFCGWACHVVALQDACTWLMNRMGVRPKPFRTRLLAWAPLVFGLYMFVWPTAKREVIFPLLEAIGAERPVWLRPVAEITGIHAELIVTDFWATFPPWYVAVPFLLVVGFATVYFLGSKGFCTYGCPYGGIFGAVDRISPGRIVVSDACESCGHCTAVCTSNVRVHEEVRDFGMVVDPGCMKCMDCVSACPNEALRFAFAAPPILARPRDDAAAARRAAIANNPKRFDLSWPEEIIGAFLFLLMFVAFRGMLNAVPMLMAAGLAGIGVFVVWKLYALLTRPSVRLQSLQLRVSGRLTRAGAAFIAMGIGTVLVSAWAGAVRFDRWSAGLAAATLEDPIAVVLRPEYVPSDAERIAAEHAERRMTRSAGWRDGGYGWALNPADRRIAAHAQMVLGNFPAALDHLQRIVQEAQPTDELADQIAAVMRRTGAEPSEILGLRRAMLDRDPDLHGVRLAIAREALAGGADPGELSAEWSRILAGDDPAGLLSAAEFQAAAGMTKEALDTLGRVARGADVGSLLRAADQYRRLGDRDAALALARDLCERPRIAPAQGRRAALLLASLGEAEGAEAALDRWLTRRPEAIALHEATASVRLARGDVDGALDAFRSAAASSREGPWELAALGETIVRAGLGTRQQRLADLGLETLTAAAAHGGSSALLHDLGQAQVACGRFAEGMASLRLAAAQAPTNAALAAAAATAEQRLREAGIVIDPR
jgi:polyferredoxin/tetratricopeptide (TPR) repeat protein